MPRINVSRTGKYNYLFDITQLTYDHKHRDLIVNYSLSASPEETFEFFILHVSTMKVVTVAE